MTGEAATNTTRPLARIVASSRVTEGGGFEVNRPFPTATLNRLDPFLLLDEMAPVHHEPGQAIGAPAHPHRGFETVTYVLQGEIEHKDSAGNHGVIGPGDVQWMTAGDGIIHSEMPSARIQTEGGLGHGLQVWVNLPSSLRRTTPRYQALPNSQLVSVTGEGWTAEVVAGSMLGVDGPAETHTPITYARVTIQPGASLRIPITDGHAAAIYLFDGSGLVGEPGELLEAQHLAVFEPSSGDLVISVPASTAGPFDSIVLAGEPIGEPIARNGPFVMNTMAEIDEAIADFNAGRMGSIPATGTT